MLNGLEIIIERMKEYPEEFLQHDGKWIDMLVNIDKHLTEEERQQLKQGFHDAARDKFNEIVLKTIAGENVTWADLQLLSVDYESVLAYPMQKRKLMEEEEKMQREMRLAKEKMAMEMQMRPQGYTNAQQAQAQGLGFASQNIQPWR